MTNMIDVNAPALQARVKKILTDPRSEWPVIAAEPTTTEKLYSSYIVPLAAIPAIAGFIGSIIFGYSGGIIAAFVWAFVMFVISLIMVYVGAIVVDKLAPKFESTSDQLQALKLVAYSYTASWLAGIFAIIPVLAPLSIVGLYSIYLFYVGLPVMMKTPESKVVPYMVVCALLIIGISIVVGLVAASVAGGLMVLS